MTTSSGQGGATTGNAATASSASTSATSSGYHGCLEGCLKAPDLCHTSPGACVNDTCVFPTATDETPCDDGDSCTASDACHAGACTGVLIACTAPPPVTCVSATEALVYDATGACANGACAYPSHLASCGSCSGDVCTPDPCVGVVCNHPYNPCEESIGTCHNGICSYADLPNGTPCDDGDPCTTGDVCQGGTCVSKPIPCNTPPSPPYCVNATTRAIYDGTGNCSQGVCSYGLSMTTCTYGCAQGACLRAPHCYDGVVNATETDVDCGGADCAPCATNKKCYGPTDCESHYCTSMGGYSHCWFPCQHDADCGGCCCATQGIVNPYDYTCDTQGDCVTAGGACVP